LQHHKRLAALRLIRTNRKYIAQLLGPAKTCGVARGCAVMCCLLGCKSVR